MAYFPAQQRPSLTSELCCWKWNVVVVMHLQELRGVWECTTEEAECTVYSVSVYIIQVIQSNYSLQCAQVFNQLLTYSLLTSPAVKCSLCHVVRSEYGERKAYSHFTFHISHFKFRSHDVTQQDDVTGTS